MGLTVAALQAQLNALGYGNLDVTGVFDEPTRRAVTAFQSDEGIVADGQVDAFTAKALARAHPTGRPAVVPVPGDPNSVRVPAKTPGGGTAGTVYLVFAEGPSSTTPEILSLLEQAGAHATFFAEEGAVAQNPDALQDITADGDGVGISVWPHDSASSIAEDVLFRTVTASQEADLRARRPHADLPARPLRRDRRREPSPGVEHRPPNGPVEYRSAGLAPSGRGRDRR